LVVAGSVALVVPGAVALAAAVPVDCSGTELTSGLVVEGLVVDDCASLGMLLVEDGFWLAGGVVSLLGRVLVEDVEDWLCVVDGVVSLGRVLVEDVEDCVCDVEGFTSLGGGVVDEVEGWLGDAEGGVSLIGVLEAVEGLVSAASPVVLGLVWLLAAMPEFWVSPAALPPVLAAAEALELTEILSFTFLTPGTLLAWRSASFLSSFFATVPLSVMTPLSTVTCTFCRSGLEASCS